MITELADGNLDQYVKLHIGDIPEDKILRTVESVMLRYKFGKIPNS